MSEEEQVFKLQPKQLGFGIFGLIIGLIILPFALYMFYYNLFLSPYMSIYDPFDWLVFLFISFILFCIYLIIVLSIIALNEKVLIISSDQIIFKANNKNVLTFKIEEIEIISFDITDYHVIITLSGTGFSYNLKFSRMYIVDQEILKLIKRLNIKLKKLKKKYNFKIIETDRWYGFEKNCQTLEKFEPDKEYLTLKQNYPVARVKRIRNIGTIANILISLPCILFLLSFLIAYPTGLLELWKTLLYSFLPLLFYIMQFITWYNFIKPEKNSIKIKEQRLTNTQPIFISLFIVLISIMVLVFMFPMFALILMVVWYWQLYKSFQLVTDKHIPLAG